MKEKGSIIDDVERKQLVWYGYVQRVDRNRLLKQVMESIILGKRKRRRPRTTWGMESERNLEQ